MCTNAAKCILQNNEIDLFEEYFAGEQPEHLSETISTKTMMIFKDPSQFKRAATSIHWHPDPAVSSVGVTYALLRFQQMPNDMPRESYIWSLNDPNFPQVTLQPPSPLTCMAFNPKNSNLVVGGSYNGSLSYFDLNEGKASGVVRPVKTTILEKSHHDPVYDVQWSTVGKSGSECFSVSTDGRMLWWDQKSEEPVPKESMILEDKVPINGALEKKVLGGTSLEYNADIGPLKYLVGTEQGYIIQVNNRKGVTDINLRYGYEQSLVQDCGKHHGPVYSLWRNPDHPKYFLSVGDWSAKIWSEEQYSPIMQTRYHQAYLTSGCWSKTRCGLFFLTRIDGFLDVWDFYYRQNEVAYSQKISDSPLTSIECNQFHNMAAVGDAEGTVSIIQLCRPLFDKAPAEKETMSQILEREFKREKTLWVNIKKEAEKKPNKKDQDIEKQNIEREQKLKKQLEDIDVKFFEVVGANEDVAAIKARGEANKKAAADAEAASAKRNEEAVGGTDVYLEENKAYKFKIENAGEFAFKVEAGGVIAGEEINGSV